jgi:hypothetical protein
MDEESQEAGGRETVTPGARLQEQLESLGYVGD